MELFRNSFVDWIVQPVCGLAVRSISIVPCLFVAVPPAPANEMNTVIPVCLFVYDLVVVVTAALTSP